MFGPYPFSQTRATQPVAGDTDREHDEDAPSEADKATTRNALLAQRGGLQFDVKAVLRGVVRGIRGPLCAAYDGSPFRCIVARVCPFVALLLPRKRCALALINARVRMRGLHVAQEHSGVSEAPGWVPPPHVAVKGVWC